MRLECSKKIDAICLKVRTFANRNKQQNINKLKHTKIMQYTVDFDIDTFPFWSGAKDRVDELDSETKERLGQHIEEMFGFDEVPPTDTTINDYVWFEWESICPSIGIDTDGNKIGSEEWVKKAIYDKYDWDSETAYGYADAFMEEIDCENMDDVDELIDEFEGWFTSTRAHKMIREHYTELTDEDDEQIDEFIEDEVITMDYDDDDIREAWESWVEEHKDEEEEGD